MTFEENFVRIKKKFDALDKSKLSSVNENIAMEVNITDDDSNGLFYIAYIDKEFKVEPYNYYDHTVRVSLSADDFVKLADRKAALDNLIKKGSVIVEKNIDHARIIFELKDKPQKKTAAKDAAKAVAKNAAKKTEKTVEKVKKVVIKADTVAKKAKAKLPEKEEVVKKAEQIAKAAEKKVEEVTQGAEKLAKAAEKKVEVVSKNAEKAVNAVKSKTKNK